MSSKKIFLKLFKFIFGALLLFIALFPVYWLIVMAVQPSEALSDPKLLPHSLTVMNFIELFTEKNNTIHKSIQMLSYGSFLIFLKSFHPTFSMAPLKCLCYTCIN